MIEFFLVATPSVDCALAGYSGIFNVPVAEVRSDLAISFRWLGAPKSDLVLEHPETGPVDRMYVAALPLHPMVELALGALSMDGWPDNAFTIVPNGFHRAVSIKLRTPPEWPGPALAVGAIDPLSANEFNAVGSVYGLKNYYAVGTQRLGPFAMTAGWGRGDHGPRSARLAPFLDGPFGGLAWALPFGFELLGEWDGHQSNYGVRWAGPWGLSAQGGRLGGGYTAGTSLAISL